MSTPQMATFNFYLNFVEGNDFSLRITFILIPFCEPLFCLKIFAYPIFDLSLFFSNSYSMISGDTVIVPGTLEEPALRPRQKKKTRLGLSCRESSTTTFSFCRDLRVRKLKITRCRQKCTV